MDMSGSAAVLGLMKVVKDVAPNCIVHGIVPTVENLVSSGLQAGTLPDSMAKACV